MDTSRSVCVFCAQSGATAPPQTTPSPTTAAPVSALEQKTDVCAIVADLLGILGLFLFAGLFGPAALILGVVSLHRQRENSELKGKAPAVFGVILGLWCTIYAAISVNTALEAFNQPEQQIQVATPATQLHTSASATQQALPAGVLAKKGDIEVLSAAEGTSGYTSSITGIARNAGQKPYDSVSLEFNLFDAQGNQVGTALAVTSNLAPGGTWSYSAAILESKAVRFELADITAF